MIVDQGPLSRYRLYGLTLESNVRFDTHLTPTDRPVDLTFTLERRSAEGSVTPEHDPTFEGSARLESGRPVLSVYPWEDGELMRFREVADFFLTDDRIACHLLDPAYDFMVEIRLLGPVFAHWFERRGVPMIHAATVSVDGTAIGFMATNKGGKSSLAASLMQQGCPLHSDDLAGIESSPAGFRARPGFPSMRFWPDQARYFHGAVDDLSYAHPDRSKLRLPVGGSGFGTFLDQVLPLRRLYLPERRPARPKDPEVEFEPVPSREAVVELVRGMYFPQLVEGTGLMPQRLEIFSRLVRDVPVQRVIYPEGLEFLPRICREILKDVRSGIGDGEEL